MKSQMSQSSHKENEKSRWEFVRIKSFGLKYSKMNISKNKFFFSLKCLRALEEGFGLTEIIFLQFLVFSATQSQWTSNMMTK